MAAGNPGVLDDKARLGGLSQDGYEATIPLNLDELLMHHIKRNSATLDLTSIGMLELRRTPGGLRSSALPEGPGALTYPSSPLPPVNAFGFESMYFI